MSDDLATRSGLPEPYRYLLADLPRDRWHGDEIAAMARFWLEMHSGFRREGARMDTLIDQWRSGERSADLWQSLAIVAVVCAVTVWQGFALGVAAGCLVALGVFVRSMNRSLVHARYTAAANPSRRMWPPAPISG